MRKKYFFFDIDGTLTTSSTDSSIPQSTLLAIKKLKEAGHFVAIATGRSYPMTLKVMEQTHIEDAVTDGGNGLCVNQKLVKMYSINREGAISICKECLNKHILFGAVITNELAYTTPYEDFVVKSENCLPHMQSTVDPLFDPDEVETYHKVFVYCDQTVENEMESRFAIPYIRYHPSMMVFEDDRKFLGIERMMRYLDAPIEDVVCFGDGKNDISMFEQAPFSIATGNAIEQLKNLASYVTDCSHHDGIYHACEHFGWFEKVSE